MPMDFAEALEDMLYDTRESPPVKTPNTTFFNAQPRISTKAKAELKPRSFAANQPPAVRLGMSDKDVKSLTGFPSESMLIAYIIIVCGGRIDLISQRCTSLTWYEEWFFHFEWKWRRSLTRWEDAEKKFGVDPRYLRRIHRRKLSLEKRCYNQTCTINIKTYLYLPLITISSSSDCCVYIKSLLFISYVLS